MYKLKQAVKRGSAFAGAVGLLAGIGTSALPAFASANELNPLTERSLTLSSSSPGWAYTDGSGNSTYAPPNSGANGKKSGNYFSFKVSSAATVNTMSFQYCTESAGKCFIPGNDSTPGTDVPGSESDLNIEYSTASEISGSDVAATGTITVTSGSKAVTGSGTSFTTALKVGGTIKTQGGKLLTIASITSNTALVLTANATTTETGVTFSQSDFNQVVDPNSTEGNVKAVPGYTNAGPKYSGSGDPAEAAKNVAGNFIVMSWDGSKWVQSTGWTAESQEVNDVTDTRHTKNYITLTNHTGVALTTFQRVKVLFFATTADYITNPGSGAFFVKINTYNKEYGDGTNGTVTVSGLAPASEANIIDGGVTVANVMNQSISIQTKVLETMQFSVGTVDPNTLDGTQILASDQASAHTACDPILTRFGNSGPKNVLQLGDQNSESSLKTSQAYATHSYWRLSSNSSGGATIYYSGHTLANTSGDEVAPIGTTAKASAPGSEQFGLALSTSALTGTTGVPNLDTATYGVDYRTAGSSENGADNLATGVLAANSGNTPRGVDSSVLTDNGADIVTPNYAPLNKSYHTPKLDPLVPTDGTSGTTNYGGGAGTITNAGSALFAFDPMSDTVPAKIASESNQVVDCVTGKMRYVANIAATTPAGIYTTKINYIAAPQY